MVKIEPRGHATDTHDEKRKADDEARARIPIHIDKTIVNDFTDGGLEKASAELIQYLQTL